MTPAARIQAAIELLREIEDAERPADGVVAEYLRPRRYIGSKDRREILARVYGVLRRRARLDWHLQRAALPPSPRTRMLADLALGGEDPARAFDGSRHAPAPLSRVERLAAAALRDATLDDAAMPAWVRGEYPQWLERALRESLGADLEAAMAALGEEAPLDLRVNVLRTDREGARAALAAEGVEAAPTPLSPWGLRLAGRVNLAALASFRDGLVEVQDEGSQLVALLAEARPGMAVIDYCAGAGGKTLALAAAMDNRGRLVACDVSAGRMERGRERFRRAGVHNIRRVRLDAEGRRQIRRRRGSFDRVLVDAPCTGTGTWRRNPDARWRLRPEALADLTATQAEILDQAAALVRPGGRLVYATCSLLAAENEAQIAAFRDRHPAFRPVPVADVWRRAVGGEPPQEGEVLRLTPHRHGTDGFFVAILQRGA